MGMGQTKSVRRSRPLFPSSFSAFFCFDPPFLFLFFPLSLNFLCSSFSLTPTTLSSNSSLLFPSLLLLLDLAH